MAKKEKPLKIKIENLEMFMLDEVLNKVKERKKFKKKLRNAK